MNIDSIWFLLGFPTAFIFGWLASRLDLRQLRTANRSAPKAYFKGLNHLLNEQQDQAIDAFIEAVQKDPDTSELHFALGNLFRRRGEYERAIRVHQHLLARADLSNTEHHRAQYELATDFLKAGLLNLAEESLRKLLQTSYAHDAYFALLCIYERSRDWQQAEVAAKALEEKFDTADFSQRRAHYLCEQALHVKQQPEVAYELLQRAIEIGSQTARPYIELARLEKQRENWAPAFALLEQALIKTPVAAPLFAADYAALACACDKSAHALQRLQALQEENPSIDLVEALIWLDQKQDLTGVNRYVAHLKHTASLLAVARWFGHTKDPNNDEQNIVNTALQAAIKPLGRYRCAACGFEAQSHYWQCPGCQSWDSYPPQRVEDL